jgi:hypothetical protein
MTAYRLYFKTDGSIVARQDFDGENDADAQQVAVVLLDACSDRCQTVDLWQGGRQVPIRLPHKTTSLPDLSDAHQDTVLRTEEVIARSDWAIARSRRLIEQLETAKLRRKI